MNKLFFAALIVIIMAAACSKMKQRVRVIENHDLNYYSLDEVSESPGSDKEITQMNESLKSIARSIAKTESMKIFFSHRIYINKFGKVDAIKQLSFNHQNYDEDYKGRMMTDSKLLMDKLSESAIDWQFTPARLEGENVAFRGDLELIAVCHSSGEVDLVLPELLTNNLYSELDFNFRKNQFNQDVEQMPFPVGGIRAIAEKIHYPKRGKKLGIEGKVFVQALVDEEGNVVSTKIIKGIADDFNKEAIKAVKQTKFIPGKNKGVAVKTRVVVPIAFKLQ